MSSLPPGGGEPADAGPSVSSAGSAQLDTRCKLGAVDTRCLSTTLNLFATFWSTSHKVAFSMPARVEIRYVNKVNPLLEALRQYLLGVPSRGCG